MRDAIELVSILCASGAFIGCLYLAVAVVAVSRFPRRPQPNPLHGIPVSILKPLHGDEPGLGDRLSGYLQQNYSGLVQLICGVRDGADAAVSHVNLVQGAIDLVVNDREHGPNRKISNLINIFDLARHDVLIVSDSDIEVGADYLSCVMAHLHREDIGAVSCLYHGIASANVWSSYEALAINSHFLPNVIVAVTFDLAKPCCGSTIAIRRDTLEALGGFGRFSKHLADDYEVGRSVRLAGHEVAIPGFTVGHHCFSSSFKALLAQELRAARTVRCIDPVGFAGAFITHPFPLALAGAVALGPNAFALAACALGLRVLLCIAIERAFSLPRQPYALLPIGEVVSFLAFCASFGAPQISWRGVSFEVTGEGELRPVVSKADRGNMESGQCLRR